jgi:hypothetical protein
MSYFEQQMQAPQVAGAHSFAWGKGGFRRRSAASKKRAHTQAKAAAKKAPKKVGTPAQVYEGKALRVRSKYKLHGLTKSKIMRRSIKKGGKVVKTKGGKVAHKYVHKARHALAMARHGGLDPLALAPLSRAAGAALPGFYNYYDPRQVGYAPAPPAYADYLPRQAGASAMPAYYYY